MTPIQSVLVTYATAVRNLRSSVPGADEPAHQPLFKALLDALLPLVAGVPAGIVAVAEYIMPGVGRPDIALKLGAEPARAHVELKSQGKPVDQEPGRSGHDQSQFRRFCNLPVWAISDFQRIALWNREELRGFTDLVPKPALVATCTAAKAAALIASHDTASLERILYALGTAHAPVATNAHGVAENLAHAARFVRDTVAPRLAELAAAGSTGEPLQLVRDEFRTRLYMHPVAAGYPDGDFDHLFAAAFAQTLAFGLLLVREATALPVDENAYRQMPNAHPLLKTTLEAVLHSSITADLGAGFDLMLATVNATSLTLLARAPGNPDPILYFYEDFLTVFDPEAKKRHGVFYTPIEVVRFQVAAMQRVLRDELGTNALLDPNVTVVDPATGTGTYLLGCVEAAREDAAKGGPGNVAPALRGLADRLFGLELLVGPYAVAHFRLQHELKAAGAPITGRLNVFLADTLARPGTTLASPHLGLLSGPIQREHEAADGVKQTRPILAVIGNPPYKRLKAGETATLVGPWIGGDDGLWDAFKAPVRDAGWGDDLNSFPDLYIAFWRWTLWRLFEAPGALGRGVACLITNRTFLAGHPYAGLRQRLRERFDAIEVYDLRGDGRASRPAGVTEDGPVFDILAGTAITLAWARGGTKPAGSLAAVTYHDAWSAGAYSRAAKLAWLTGGTAVGRLNGGVPARTGALDDMRPAAVNFPNWIGLDECFLFRSSGMETKRDEVVYDFAYASLTRKVDHYVSAPVEAVTSAFNPTDLNPFATARAVGRAPLSFKLAAYRPFDTRHHYRHSAWNDRLRTQLQSIWGDANICLFALPTRTGDGPSVWCHGLVPDRHAFRGSTGGYAFPLHDRQPLSHPVNLAPRLMKGLAAAHGSPSAPENVFDAILGLLSARSYTLRFAADLEGDFPHVPFPRDTAVMARAAALGARIRTLQTFAGPADPAYDTAIIATAPSAATTLAGSIEHGAGAIILGSDGTARVEGVPIAVWEFAVSGYALLQRWLLHRRGQRVDAAMLDAVRDLVARIGNLIALMADADAVLVDALGNSLSRADFGL
jgi:hypothetical protein